MTAPDDRPPNRLVEWGLALVLMALIAVIFLVFLVFFRSAGSL